MRNYIITCIVKLIIKSVFLFFAYILVSSLLITVIEMIETVTDMTRRVGCGRRKDVSASTKLKRTEIATNDTRGVRWSGRRVEKV